MKINRNNYEPYFIDYLEGNLDEKLVDDFLEFLQKNPDLKSELSLFDTVNIEPEEVTFTKKEILFKEKYDKESEFNQAAIAQMEGDMQEAEKRKFEEYIQTHPEKQVEVARFQATRLIPDLKIMFRKKSRLYHYSAGRTVLMWSSRIAAILVLAFALYAVVDKTSNKIIPENQLAKVDQSTPQREVPQKKEPQKTQKITPEETKQETEEIKTEVPEKAKKSETKKAEPAQKKSLRETNPGRLEKEGNNTVRMPVEAPPAIKSMTAALEVPKVEGTLGTMYITIPDVPQDNDERFLADVVMEKTGLDNLSVNKIKKAGLKLVSGFTKDNLSYETNKEGKITEIIYDSRLLAFTIPTNNKEREKAKEER